jgi:predicted nucleic acid-binding protein
VARLSVCVDASVAVQIVTREDHSRQADALWTDWLRRGLQPIAPPVFPYEVCSVLRQKAVLRKELTPGEEKKAVELFLSLNVQTLSPPGHLQAAWELATELGLPTVYDAAYLALARIEGGDFWTADRRFYSAVHARFDNVRWLGGYRIPDESSLDAAAPNADL